MNSKVDAPQAKRIGRPGHDRDSVVRTAVSVFNEHGYNATSMEQLARSLGISKAGIYHHFDSKEQILEVALDEGLGQLECVLTSVATSEEPAIDRLIHVVTEAVKLMTRQLPFVTLLLRVRGNSEIERAALQRRRAVDREFAKLVQAAIDAGELRSDIEPQLASRLLFGMINSIGAWYSPDGADSTETLIEHVVHIAFDGLRAK